MKDEVTLTQLAAEMAQLQQQIEQMNRRLDMIYGAVTRLAEAKLQPQPPAAGQMKRPASLSSAAMSFPAQALLDPGSMLASLYQHAVKAGLTIPTDSMERLQAELPAAEANDDSP
jgi:glycine/D-amino acid oxidase-like deaminating enzyme